MIHHFATIYPGVVFSDRETVVIEAGAVVGVTCPTPDGRARESVGVTIGRGVRIGSGAVIMAGTHRPTVIGDGVVIGALAAIGHDVEIGARTYVAPQAGIAGDTNVGEDCRLGGQSGVANGATLEARVSLAGQAGAAGDLRAGEYAGSPAMPIASWRRMCVATRQIFRR